MKRLGAALILLFTAHSLEAANCISMASGSWTNTSIWSCGAVPGAADAVTMSHVITVSGAESAASVTMSGGELTGTGSLTVSGTFTWDGGQISTTVNLDSTARMDVATADNYSFSGGRINNSGRLVTAKHITASSGAVIDNKAGGTVEFTADHGIDYSGGGQIINAGTIVKSGGTGVTPVGCGTLCGTTGTFTNTGMIRAMTGTIELHAILTNSSPAALIAEPGTTVHYNGRGGQTFNTGTAFSGGGSHLVARASTFNGALSVATGTTLTISAASDSVTWNTATLTGTLDWQSASMHGSLTTDAASVVNVLTGGTAYSWTSGTVTNFGTWNLSSHISANAGIFDNRSGATLDSRADAGWSWGDGTTQILNAGTIVKTAGTAVSHFGCGTSCGTTGTFTNTGTIRAMTGTIELHAILTNSSPAALIAEPGTTIHYNGRGGQTFNSGTAFSGGGSHLVARASTFNGALSVATGTTLTISAASDSVTWNAATLTGTLDWHSASMIGSLTTDAASVVNVLTGGTAYSWTNGTVTNFGTWNLSSHISANAGIFDNRSGATLDSRADAGWSWGDGTTRILNAGTILKTAGTAVSHFGCGTSCGTTGTFTNTGTIRAMTGTIELHAILTNTSPGAFVADSGTTINYNGRAGQTFDTGTSFSGAGTHAFQRPSTFNGAITSTAGAFRLAMLNQDDTATWNSATFSGPLEWQNAAMSGTLTTASGTVVTLTSGMTHRWNGGTWTNRGTIYIDQVPILVTNTVSTPSTLTRSARRGERN
jgi:hypothetical protein